MKHGIFRALLLSAMLVSISVMACRKKITETAREQNGGTSSTQQNTKSNALDVLKIAFDTKAQVGDIVRIDDTFYVKFNKAEFEKDKGKIAIATLEVSPKAHATIQVGDSMDFSNENQKLNFLVEAEAGASKTYYVSGTYKKSSENDIIKIQLEGEDDTKDPQKTNADTTIITIRSSTGVNLASLSIKTLTVSPFAKSSIEQGSTHDFSNNKKVQITVTAEDGTKKDHYVRVNYVRNSEKNIIKFELVGQDLVANPTKYDTAGSTKKIHIQMRKSTPNFDIKSVKIQTLTISPRATISPAQTEAQDFTNPVTYTVTAEDKSTKTYQVSVEVLQSDENKIEQFQIKSPIDQKILTGQIDQNNNTITLVVDAGTNTSFASTFAPSKIDISPNAKLDKEATQSQDFAKPVTYTVTSESGKTRQYTVNVRYRFQILNGDFEQWYTYSYANPRVSQGNGSYEDLGGSRDNTGGWDSYNRGFWMTARSGTTYPVSQTTGKDGKSKAVRMLSQTYQNSASFGTDYPFGISPGAIFTGSLTDFSEYTTQTRNNNYKRGVIKFSPLNFGSTNVLHDKPVSISFDYQYKPGGQMVEAQDAWNYGTNPKGYYHNVSGTDQMEGYVLFLSANNQVVAVAGIRSGTPVGSWTTKTLPLRYSNSGLNVAEQNAVNGKAWAASGTEITKVQVLFTASYEIKDYFPIGAAGSELVLDNLRVNYQN